MEPVRSHLHTGALDRPPVLLTWRMERRKDKPRKRSRTLRNFRCKNMTRTAEEVWFILIILFGVFTNKHMQEEDSD